MYGGTSEQLKAYSINVTPPKKAWVPLTDALPDSRISLVALQPFHLFFGVAGLRFLRPLCAAFSYQATASQRGRLILIPVRTLILVFVRIIVLSALPLVLMRSKKVPRCINVSASSTNNNAQAPKYTPCADLKNKLLLHFLSFNICINLRLFYGEFSY